MFLRTYYVFGQSQHTRKTQIYNDSSANDLYEYLIKSTLISDETRTQDNASRFLQHNRHTRFYRQLTNMRFFLKVFDINLTTKSCIVFTSLIIIYISQNNKNNTKVRLLHKIRSKVSA